VKTVFITGANKGIGFETAKQLAALGYYVYIGSRNKLKGMEAINKLNALGLSNVSCIEIDVTNIDSIKAARKELENKIPQLDILINNAGIAGSMPQAPSTVSTEVMRFVFEVNFFGVITTTQEFIELMKNAVQPRIINVTSELGSLTNHNDPNWKFYTFKHAAYGPSKTALNAYTVALAYELRNTNFTVNCVSPGYTATDFNNYRGEQPVEEGAAIIVKYTTLEQNVTGKFFGAEGEVEW